MKAFSELFTAIDRTTSTNEKVDALVGYLEKADLRDATWAVALLMGRRPKRSVKTSGLRDWCAALSHLPLWLLEESYHVVGDLAEAIALVLPPAKTFREIPLHVLMQELIALADQTDEEREAYVVQQWQALPQQECFLFNKLITGEFRVGVSSKIVIKALAKRYALDENAVAHRLMGDWHPSHVLLDALLEGDEHSLDISQPYPFYLAYALEDDPASLGDIHEWQIERKYDGIRGQVIVRNNELFVWSRGEDLLTDKFPEFGIFREAFPDGTVIDGEILPMKNEQILPFHVMQTRTGRKNVTKKTLEEAPLVIMAYDLLEQHGQDLRNHTMQQRRALLEALVEETRGKFPQAPVRLSPLVNCSSWEEAAAERLRSREFDCEGLMLKRLDSVYKTGRRRGDWWKWKVDPLTVDGVLFYAARGNGRRANLYTDYTFAVWDGDELVPFAKAYSGLTDQEILEVDAWIRKNTLDKFGPVRSVKPELVFELAFEGINPSPRHKSGVAIRFPRILRWRQDKPAREANTKADLLELLRKYGTRE